MARSMKEEKGLPKSLWAEAVNTSIYILNHSPTKAVRNKTPYEAWNNKKPIVNHLKIFGCIAYALNKDQRKDKFDPKGKKYLFVGYSEESKGYRLLDPHSKKLIVSRDVIFDESAKWKWDDDEGVQTQLNVPTQDINSNGNISTTLNDLLNNPRASPNPAPNAQTRETSPILNQTKRVPKR
ncbi:unnamed protein product [Amaranthus hypochondriacus]